MTTDVGADLSLQWGVQSPDEPQLNQDFIFDIDEAMKAKVDKVTWVTDIGGANQRQVKAFFRWPQVEITDQTFPVIVVDRLAGARAADREQRAEYPLIPYTPKGFTAPPTDHQEQLLTAEMPIPFDFTYQITVHSRFWLHDTRITEQMLQDFLFPPRGAWLQVNDTVRQMFVNGPIDASGMDSQPGGRPKRHFRKVWTATVSGELFQKDIEQFLAATSISTTIEIRDYPDQYVTEQPST